ncbi:MAG: ATP-binding cassette domain-containing protein [Thermogemmatispora sp.]|uniref:ABC transporter ATP-binding protein n=1 Tax=Thermogemmatispora sp. TaxID=1968838 RepID=UPI0026278B0F|nr:energy-coupling factor transporter ATPase [Thermogemmatispora sp.]MBX5457337.1 ATP-binding cassette domain-containing protein [Thermogemmatispora sp.]
MSETRTALIEIEDLTVKYPGRRMPALEHLQLQLRAGETLLLLGPSGSGKSTLALTLNGLIPHSIGKLQSGHVRVAGLDTRQTTVAALAQRVGILFQDPEAQFVMFTVEDEIAFGLENLCFSPDEMERRISESLRLVGLTELRYRRVEQLSGGEKQRVALAALLALEPEILVFDEPTANLDPQGTREVFDLLRRCKETGRYTIVLIEHRLDELMDLVERMVVLDKRGEVVIDGTPREVLRAHLSTLQELGVWVPQVARLAHALQQHGWPLEPFPLTLSEAVEALKERRPLSAGRQASSALPSLVSVHNTGRQRSPASPPIKPDPGREEAAIEVCSLSYRAAGRQVLQDISLAIPRGAFLALVGANGAGKTTLAQHLIGVLQPPRGCVHLLGRDITTISARELTRHVGYVFQNPEHQFITEAVEDEVAYGLRVMGLPATEVQGRTHALLERFNLLPLARANPFTLSHGEKRRLSVATMLAMGQEILILDEPTFGQDEYNATALLELLWQLHSEGRTVVIITHDMSLVATYAQYVAVMNHGRLLFYGTPAALFAREELLAEARLMLPPLAQLARRLGWSDLLTLEELCERCLQDSSLGLSEPLAAADDAAPVEGGRTCK